MAARDLGHRPTARAPPRYTDPTYSPLCVLVSPYGLLAPGPLSTCSKLPSRPQAYYSLFDTAKAPLLAVKQSQYIESDHDYRRAGITPGYGPFCHRRHRNYD